jgi:hypothetical protein
VDIPFFLWFRGEGDGVDSGVCQALEEVCESRCSGIGTDNRVESLTSSCDVKMQDKLNAATTLREIENWQDLRDLQVAIKRGELDSMME